MEIGKEWTFEHTIECSVSSDFAWKFWTKVENWVVDADLESVELRVGSPLGLMASRIAKAPEESNGISKRCHLQGGR